MKKRFFGGILFLLTVWQLNAATFFVKPGATGSGESWTNASGDLRFILTNALAGDEVWVAKGVYFPTTDYNRTHSFPLNNGVAVYGGFEGSETSLGERIIKKHYSVLSGEIGTSQKTDNTINVVTTTDATDTTILDGFIITGGYAGGGGPAGNSTASGGGLYLKGLITGLHIRNCHFVENTARDGGAIYYWSANSQSNYWKITECRFQNNKAFLGGGAVFNSASTDEKSDLQLKKCTFLNNSAGFGGAIFQLGLKGKATAFITESEFRGNTAMIQGGCIYHFGNQGLSVSKLINCKFTENRAPRGNTVAYSIENTPLKLRETKL